MPEKGGKSSEADFSSIISHTNGKKNQNNLLDILTEIKAI